MRILFFGDIVGRAGREGLAASLPELRQTYQPDFMVANAENAAAGKGLTPKTAQFLWDLGIDVLTLGNHSFDRKEIAAIIADPRILRPANYPPGVPGQGAGVYRARNGASIAVVQLMGRVYLPLTDCPFRAADGLLRDLEGKASFILVDAHAEITSEKAALAFYMDGRAHAVIGTHTHVQTSDARLLPKGTAFVTDAGACAPLSSVIGLEASVAMERFLKALHTPLVVAAGDVEVCGVFLEMDEISRKTTKIETFRRIIPMPHPPPEDK